MPHQRLDRSWGTRFDSLTSSDSLSSNPESVVASSHSAASPPRSVSADDGSGLHDAHDRILHDASIFIGSLPANIEYPELTAMLSQHLSEHPQVKGIKVVRDSKGGTCAFIQCQDAEAASILMHNLHVSPPHPFLGRYLRYEPARAFRTLLISYRAYMHIATSNRSDFVGRSPKQYIRHRELSRRANFPSADEPRFVELPLPDAMRIVRTPGNKQLTVLFNAEALTVSPTEGTDPSLIFVPLLYDAETLFRIASVLGAVDYFAPYAHGDGKGQVSATFPVPHDGPRSPGMDPGCWKIKWAHRDDCISALVTLRRIPHLTVTWAHQSSISPREHGYYFNPRPFSGIQASQSWRGHGTGHALRSASSFLPASRTFPALRTVEDPSDVEHPCDVKVTDLDPGCDSWQREASTVQIDQNTLPSRSSRPRALSLTHDRPPSAVSLPSRESTGQLSFTNWESTNRTRWADHVESMEFKTSPSVAGPNLTSSPYLCHHVASSDNVCHCSKEGDSPDFGASPVTPRTPMSLMLRTPTTASYMGDFQSMSFKDYDSQGSLPQLLQEKRDDHAVDPTTIFVGGLEMFGPNAWDEGKVKALFSKYGGIEAVKVIRPSNKRSAFAFVRFNNTEAPLRAIKGEHNRMLDGRLIRVQLRDWNPAYRPSWRSGPSKETDIRPLCSSDDLGVDPRPPKPGVVNITAHMADLQLTDSPTPPVPTSSGDACDLNEVQTETGIPPSDVSSADDVACGSTKEVRLEKSTDIKQGEPASPDTVLASSQTSMAPVPALPAAYPAPTIQYYQGWIPNYAPPFPYPMPFTGPPYPSYPFPPPPAAPPPLQSGGSEGGGTTSNTTIPLGPTGGVYPAFMPYPPPLGHNSDSTQATSGHPGVANNHALLHSQAPLVPTGFIQGDQGMLVPVYPPDALNQYMAGNQEPSQAPVNSGSAEGQTAVAWHPYPPPPMRPQAVIFHSYINPPLTAPPPPHLGAQAWIPGHPWHGVAPQLGNPNGVLGRRIASSPAGGPMGSNFERNLVPPRRQFRRDNYSHHHKNNFARGTAGRFSKAPIDAPRSPTDIQPTPVPQLAMPGASIDANWQRWNTEQGNLA